MVGEKVTESLNKIMATIMEAETRCNDAFKMLKSIKNQITELEDTAFAKHDDGKENEPEILKVDPIDKEIDKEYEKCDQGKEDSMEQCHQKKSIDSDKDTEDTEVDEQEKSFGSDKDKEEKLVDDPGESNGNDKDSKEVDDKTKSIVSEKDAKGCDVSSEWIGCTCDKAECSTCEAEREATVAANMWFDSQTVDIDPEEEDQSKSEKTSENEDQHLKFMYASCIVDEEFSTQGRSFKHVMKLHPALSADGYCKSQRACGLIAFLFADMMIKGPNIELAHIVESTSNPTSISILISGSMYIRLLKSIKEGADTYIANYGRNKVDLQPQDIVLIYSQLGFSIKQEIQTDETGTFHTLAHHIMQLQETQMILFIRLEDYRAFTIVNIYKNTQVLIFDSQSHKLAEQGETDEVPCGGIIYQMIKGMVKVVECLSLLEEHCGKLKGPCKIAILEL